MEFKKSKYYNEKFLGKFLYSKIYDEDKLLTVQEYFNVNPIDKEYCVKDEDKDYSLKVFDEYYELKCEKDDAFLFLAFDKPVHVTGKYCGSIIAPEIIVENARNKELSFCFCDKLIINNNYKYSYGINFSKIDSVYFYNSAVKFWNSEVSHFFILNPNLCFKKGNILLDYHKIECLVKCKDLKNKLSYNENLRKGIIHIE